MNTFIRALIAVGACVYILAMVHGWGQLKDETDWPWFHRVPWTPVEGLVIIMHWVTGAAGWAFRNGRPVAAHRSRKLMTWGRGRRAGWRRWQADRRRPVTGEVPPPVANLRMTGPSPAPSGQPEPDRTVAMPKPRPAPAAPPPGSAPAPAPAGGSFGAPVGGAPNAMGPFAAPIEWIASRDPEDSNEFENDLKLMFDGWLGMGEAFEQFAETCAESGIGLDPVVIRSILDLAGQVSENGEATVRVKKVLDAVYEGFREWAATHRPTKDGRWIQPESGAGPQAGAA